MGPFDVYGLSEQAARDLIERELARSAASTTFHWESDELDEVLDILTEVFAKVIAANNRALTQAIKKHGLSDMQIPPGI